MAPIADRYSRLIVLDVGGLDRSVRYLAAGFQGLVNREAPRIYLVGYWSAYPMSRFLAFYEERHGVTHEEAGDVWEVLPAHVLEALTPYAGDETVRPVFLPQMFDLMALYPPEN